MQSPENMMGEWVYMSISFADNSLVGILNLLRANEINQIRFTVHKTLITLLGMSQSNTIAIYISFPATLKSSSPQNKSITFCTNIDTMYGKVSKIRDKWTMTVNKDNTITCTTESLGGTFTTTETTIEDIPFTESDFQSRIAEVISQSAKSTPFQSTILCEALKLPIIGKSNELVYQLELTSTHLNITTYSEYNKTSSNKFALPVPSTTSSPPFSINLKANQIEKILGFGTTFDRCDIMKIGELAVFNFTQMRDKTASAIVWITESVID